MVSMDLHANTSDIRRVAILIELTSGYGEGIIRGIGRYTKTVENWQCDGIVPSGSTMRYLRRDPPDGMIFTCRNRDFAKAAASFRGPIVDVVDIYSRRGKPQTPRVIADDVAAGRLAAEHLLACRLKPFALVGDFDMPWTRRRMEGFAAGLESSGFEPLRFNAAEHPHKSWLATHWLAAGVPLQTWLADLPRPIGLLGANDLWALRTLDGCRKIGLRVPDEAAVLGVGNDPLFCDLAQPPLRSIAIDLERVGYQAGALLDRLMAGEAVTGQQILIPNRGLIVRQSTDLLAVSDTAVIAAVRFIRLCGGKGISAAHVVAHVRLPRRALERRFRKLLNRGIQEEIRRVRLDRVKALLRETDLPLKVINVRTGFSSISRMVTSFHDATGITPRKYRSQFRIMEHY